LLYSILEASKQLGVSKVTAYKKINSVKELKQYITVKNNVKYINDKGLEELRSSLCKQVNSKPLTNTHELNDDNSLSDKPVSTFTDLQKDYITHLKAQLEIKDSQISKLIEELNTKSRLLENSQILQKQQQDKVLLLESSDKKERPSIWNRFLKGFF
jgi:hypothetical protein